MSWEKLTQDITFYAFYVASKVGKTSLTVTVDVWEHTRTGTATEIVSGGSATEIGDGIYKYVLSAASVDAIGEYIAVFKTADATVDQQHIPALWVVGRSGVENLDAAVSTRLPTSSYTAPTTPPTTAAIADAVWDEALSGHATAGTSGAALNAAGGAADPLLNAVPGSYASGTAGYALGKVSAISDAAVYSNAATDNAMTLADAVQGALRPAQQITWLDASGIAVDLTGATITGYIRGQSTGDTRAITGTLTITNAAAGVFTWSYSAADVIDSGTFDVQFVATYSTGLTPAKTFTTTWHVFPSLGV